MAEMIVHATYEAGVFKPISPVQLPEHCEVEFEPRIIGAETDTADLGPIYAILDERYRSGSADTSARHDEHQP